MIHPQGMVSFERIRLAGPHEDHHQRKGVGIDGGMVHIRGKGWKEMKVGAVFDVEIRLGRDPDSHELVEQPYGVRMEYSAVLGSPEDLSPALWRLAVQRQIPLAAESSVTADGADWIWNLATDLFPDSVQIVDWYHACQHLAAAATALYPDDPDRAHRWLKQRKDALFLGHVHTITHPLVATGLSEHARYFHTHQRRMQYHEFRENHYPIGSGTTESGIKQFKARLTGSGMRWSRPAAQQMLVIVLLFWTTLLTPCGLPPILPPTRIAPGFLQSVDSFLAEGYPQVHHRCLPPGEFVIPASSVPAMPYLFNPFSEGL